MELSSHIPLQVFSTLCTLCVLVYVCLYQFSSVAQSCPTLCDPMNHSMQGLPVHHQLPEFTQTHVHRVSDAIQPSHPVVPFSCPQSLPASVFPMSQLFAWGGQSTRVSALASFLPNNTQDWSPCSPRDSQESSPTILGKKSLEGPSLFMCLFTPSTVLCHKVDTQRMNGQHRKNITQNQYDYPTSSYKTCPYSGISFNSSDS